MTTEETYRRRLQVESVTLGTIWAIGPAGTSLKPPTENDHGASPTSHLMSGNIVTFRFVNVSQAIQNRSNSMRRKIHPETVSQSQELFN